MCTLCVLPSFLPSFSFFFQLEHEPWSTRSEKETCLQKNFMSIISYSIHSHASFASFVSKNNACIVSQSIKCWVSKTSVCASRYVSLLVTCLVHQKNRFVYSLLFKSIQMLFFSDQVPLSTSFKDWNSWTHNVSLTQGTHTTHHGHQP